MTIDPAPGLHTGALASSLCTGGQWITGIVMSGHKLRVEGELHGVLSRAKLVRSRVPGPDWSTGVGSSSKLCNATRVHRPAAPSCWTIRVRRVSFLTRVTNAIGARLFPQSKLICGRARWACRRLRLATRSADPVVATLANVALIGAIDPASAQSPISC